MKGLAIVGGMPVHRAFLFLLAWDESRPDPRDEKIGVGEGRRMIVKMGCEPPSIFIRGESRGRVRSPVEERG